MRRPRSSGFDERTVDRLTIEDERSFRHVPLYADLKEVLRASKYRFRILPKTRAATWDRALLLNLTFWGNRAGGDVLVHARIPADVVAHAAWHHVAARELAGPHSDTPQTAEALFLGEAIASAFDVYMVGRLLGRAPASSFLSTQVPAMAEVARAAGLSKAGFASLLKGIAADPERAFEDLRALLFDATTGLMACTDADDARRLLARLDGHRFGPLLHRYELSGWVLYARAYAAGALGPDARVRAVDRTLRRARVALDWLASHWLML